MGFYITAQNGVTSHGSKRFRRKTTQEIIYMVAGDLCPEGYKTFKSDFAGGKDYNTLLIQCKDDD